MLLAPTVIYVRDVLKLIEVAQVKVRAGRALPPLWTIRVPVRPGFQRACCLVAGVPSGRKLLAPPVHPQSVPVGATLPDPTPANCPSPGPLLAAAQGLVHITGGGFPENIPRVVPKGLATQIDRSAWEIPALFQWVQKVRASPLTPLPPPLPPPPTRPHTLTHTRIWRLPTLSGCALCLHSAPPSTTLPSNERSLFSAA